MEATAKSIWRVPAYLPYVQPTLTDRTIAAAEQEIGCSLPHEYLDLLRVQNGGYIRFSLPEMDIVHDLIKGIGSDANSLTDTQWKDYQESLSFPLDGLVPFDDGNGQNYACLDYRHDPAHPSVTYIDTEGDRQAKKLQPRSPCIFRDFESMSKTNTSCTGSLRSSVSNLNCWCCSTRRSISPTRRLAAGNREGTVGR